MGDDSSSPSLAPHLQAGEIPRRRASEIIDDFLAHNHGESIAVGDLTALLGDRAFGMLLLVLTMPNVIPLPGLSTATGLPMILLGGQIAAGLSAPRLPRRLASISFARDSLLAVLRRARPWLERVEKRVRPRAPWFAYGTGERLAGVFIMILAAVLSLPIVFGNLAPAVAIAAISLGLIEKDGLLIAGGMIGGLMAVAFVAAIVFGLGEAAIYAVSHLFPAFHSQAIPTCSPIC